MSTENEKWVLFEGGNKEWNNLVFDSNGGCYQSYEWGEYKKQMGWIPFRIIRLDYDVVYVVQVLAKKYWKFSLMFIPGLGPTKYLDEQFFEYIRQLVGVNFIYLRCSFPIKYDQKKYDSLIDIKWRAPFYNIGARHSMMYYLSDSDDIRLTNASKNWRHNLRRALKKEIVIKITTSSDINKIIEIYRDMEYEKGIREQFSETETLNILDVFGDKILLYYATNSAGELLGLRGALLLGNNAVDFMAATTVIGRNTYSSYMLFWELTKKCKSLGVLNYDMGGIDKINNKGVYHFKKGTGAKEIRYLGEFEMATGIIARIAINCIILFRKKLQLI